MKKPIGFQLSVPKGSKIVTIPMADDLKEYFRELSSGKGHHDYLKEFLGGEKNFSIAEKALKDAMHESLHPSVKEKCLFCNGKSQNEDDRGCLIYFLQMDMTFMIAAIEFINIVLRNKIIYENKRELQNLTVNFYNCLTFTNGEGKMYLDLEQLCRYALQANFDAVGKIFSESEVFKNLQIINETLNHIDDKALKNEVLKEEDDEYLDLQKRFFEQKQRYYKEKIFLNDNMSLKENGKRQQKRQMSIPQYALYYYYLQNSGYYPYFENHINGKLQAIEELVLKENIGTTGKYFQLRYNFINNHQTNRIAKNQVANISYVIDKLNDFPKAKELAISELKQAQTKNK